MLFDIPIIAGAVLTTVFVLILLFTNSYRRIERGIIAFVSVIGLSFLYELFLVDVDWGLAARSWVTPSIPQGSMLIIMSVLGAVVMPHNLFLHSEVVQSREYNKEDEQAIKKHLKYEFYDTLLSMGIGWAINSAMILLAATTFFVHGTPVEELQQAKSLLDPCWEVRLAQFLHWLCSWLVFHLLLPVVWQPVLFLPVSLENLIIFVIFILR